MSAALGHPHFKRDGGVLGFVCRHKYVYTDLNKTSSLPHLLKGADQIVYSVAKSLGLSVIVKPVLSDHFPGKDEGEPEDEVTVERTILLERFPEFGIDEYFDEFDKEYEAFTRLFERGHHIKYVTWCQKFDDCQQQVAGCIGTYGNNPSIDVFYQTAAILVGIPEWGEHRKRLSNVEEPWSGAGKVPMSQSETIIEKLCFHGEMPTNDDDDV